ncbi:CopG family antitoxin [Anaerobaca lacustris]|uniref:CopG family antitoxin n=1 Tax=Anaerobaca lacustris TaxID=3044600 RepID=A0AAW6TTY3_9BACT|nr:CopG family antitoxin [Sedimentisphaerales bacterium M17dextr]
MKESSEKKRRVTRRKSSVSEARTYAEIGDFWDEHDLSDYWDATRFIRVDVELESEESLYAVEKGLSDTIRRAAKERGVSPHTLINLWLQEKVQKLKLGPGRG